MVRVVVVVAEGVVVEVVVVVIVVVVVGLPLNLNCLSRKHALLQRKHGLARAFASGAHTLRCCVLHPLWCSGGSPPPVLWWSPPLVHSGVVCRPLWFVVAKNNTPPSPTEAYLYEPALTRG